MIPIKANLAVLMVNGLAANQGKLRQSDSTRSTSHRITQCNDLKFKGFLGYVKSKPEVPELCNPDKISQNKGGLVTATSDLLTLFKQPSGAVN